MNRYKIIQFIIVLVLIVFTLFIFLSLDNNLKDAKHFLKENIEKEAQSYYHSLVDIWDWNSKHGGIYIKENGENKFSRVSPIRMTKEISTISNKSNNIYFKITSLNPINPLHKADKFEEKALLYLEKNRDKEYYIETDDNLNYHDFLGVLKIKKSCLSCHEESSRKIGEIRGGIRVSIPTKRYNEQIKKVEKKHDILISLVFVLSFFLILVFIVLINRLKKKHNSIEKNLEDIKKLEKSKEKLISRFEYAMNGTKDGLWDWNIKDNTLYLSKNWKLMLGYEDHEIDNNFEEWKKRVHPDDLDSSIKDINDNIEGKTERYKNIHRLRHKDGSWVWILDRGKTYYDENGKAERMVGFHSNINELKTLELELQRAKLELTEFRIVIESAPLSIMITDVNENISYVNPHFCYVTGYEKMEVLGKNPISLKFTVNEEETDKIEDLRKNLLSKKTWGGIFKNIRKSGEEYWETATVVPILDDDKNIMNILWIMREITKEVYLEKKLNEKEELMLIQSKSAAMGEMISMIAHQWRQPITTISMSANNIIADIELEMFEEDKVKEAAQNISLQTQFLSKTIDDFRNFFKKDKQVEEVSISELINELFTIILASLKNHDIKINTEYNEDLKVKTFRRELLQVLLNLVKNAKEAFTDKDISQKLITISVKEDNGMVEMDIKDNAGGIKKENEDKIFNAYFTTKEEYNGTGLGLYMSKTIVEKHLEGSLSFENIDDGVVFKIRFKNFH